MSAVSGAGTVGVAADEASGETAVAQVQEVVRGWDRALRALLLYGRGNQAVDRFFSTLREQMGELWEQLPELSLTVEENAIRWGEEAVYTAEGGSESLPFMLYRDGLRELHVLPGFEEKELGAWIAILARVHRVRGEDEDLLTLLWEGEWTHLRYSYVEALSEGMALPAASGRAVERVAAPREQEPPDIPATVRAEDFRGAAYFLDPDELRRIRQAVDTEMRRDLAGDVLAALFDRFDDGESERQVRIVGILADLLPVLLAAAQLERATTLLSELVAISTAAPPPPAEVMREIQALFGKLSEPATLRELVTVAEEAPGLAASESLQAFLTYLPPSALAPLLELAEETANELREVLLAAVEQLAAAHPQRVPLLFDAEEPILKAGGARLVGRLQLTGQTERVVRLLRHESAELRAVAVEALRELRSPVAAAALERVLDDDAREVRIAAARALSELAYAPARQTLESIVESKRLEAADLTERIAFYEAYGSVAGSAGVEPLDRVLNGRSWIGRRPDAESRACAALGLGKIRLPAAREALERASSDPDPVVRSAVGRALRSA